VGVLFGVGCSFVARIVAGGVTATVTTRAAAAQIKLAASAVSELERRLALP